MKGLITAFACLLACTACGPDTLTDIDQSDAGTKDAGGDPWTWSAPQCAKPPVRDVTFRLSSGGRGQIAPSLSFDGRLYASWSQPPADPDDANFDVMARVFDCNGVPASDNVRLSTTAESNDVGARIVAVPGGALVAWSGSLSAAPYNAVMLRAINEDGATVGAERTLFPADSAWMPDLTLLPDGDVGVAMLHSIDEQSFRAAFHRLDPLGAMLGSELVMPPGGVSHGNPTLAATDDALHLVWERDDGAPAATIETASVLSGGVGDVSTVAPGRAGDYPRSDGWLGDGGRAWVVFGSKVDNVSSLVLEELGGELRTELGIAGRVNVAPAVAASDDGGAVAWITQEAGGVKSLLVQRFRAGTAGLSTSDPVTLPTTELKLQSIDVEHLSGNDFVVAWTEGSHPNSEVKARVVALE